MATQTILHDLALTPYLHDSSGLEKVRFGQSEDELNRQLKFSFI